jgi:hypothetical protein
MGMRELYSMKGVGWDGGVGAISRGLSRGLRGGGGSRLLGPTQAWVASMNLGLGLRYLPW